MDKKDILRLAKDPKYISGIYNYCDRWCERCLFTSRCLNYAMTVNNIDDQTIYDLNNKIFWQKLQLIFQQTKEMITELAEERGIDLNSLDMESGRIVGIDRSIGAWGKLREHFPKKRTAF